MNETEQLLRTLAAGDEGCLSTVLSRGAHRPQTLDRETRALVRLSALIAADAGTASLRWAVDIAWSTGADDVALVQVLLTSLAAAGAAQRVISTPRMALALDYDLEVDGWDGT